MDIAVVDSVFGSITPCEWLHVDAVNFSSTGSRVMACCLRGATPSRIAIPDEWQSANSLSQRQYLKFPELVGGMESPLYFLGGGPE